MGLVDFLLHGYANREEQSQQHPLNLDAMAFHIKETVRTKQVPEKEDDLAKIIAETVTEIRQRLYDNVPWYTDSEWFPKRVPTKIMAAPTRRRTSMMGVRVAAIEPRNQLPGGIQSSRLHALIPPRKGRVRQLPCVSEELDAVIQPPS